MMDQAPVTAQITEVTQALPRVACAGDSIVAIEVRRYPPSSDNATGRALEATSEAVGIEHAATDVRIVQAYIRLKKDGVCTETDRTESERLLRAQPFIASASVSALRVAPGRVIVRVVIVDEWPYVVGGAVRGGRPSMVRLGAQNIGGRGLTAVTTFENGGVHRTGYGMRLERYGFVGRPAVGSITAERRPLGGLIDVEVQEPFLTDGQRFAFHAGVAEEKQFLRLVRDTGSDAAAETARRSYDVSWVARIGRPRRNGLVGLAGVSILREEARTTGGSVILSDSGIHPTNDGELDGRFPEYEAGRIGGIVGVRMLRYITVERFAALRAAQDVGRGLQASAMP